MKVLVTSNSFGKFEERAEKLLTENGFEVKLNPYKRIMNEAEFSAEITDADAVILGTEELNETVLKAAVKLKIVSRYGVGIDNIDTDYLARNNIPLTITKGCNHESVADFTIGLMLDVARGISYTDRKLRTTGWQKKVGVDLCHKTVGVIGTGSIGKEVIKRLTGFGCRILAYDLFYDEAFCRAYGIKRMELSELFRQADILTLHVPGNQNAKPLIGEAEIGMMKDKVLIINTARLSLIDEAALLNGLKIGKIGGYGADAQLKEDDINQALYAFDNVVLTPHNAAVTIEASNKMSYAAAEHIMNYFKKMR